MGDTNWDTVKFLSNFNGTDGATAFTMDAGPDDPSAPTQNFFADAQLDTARKKWGTASLLFDGSGDYVTLTGTSMDDYFDFLHDRTTDWTFETFFYIPTSFDNNYPLIDFVDGGILIYINNSGGINTYIPKSGGTDYLSSSTGVVSTDTWHFLQYRFNSTTSLLELYLDATLMNSKTLSSTIYTAGNTGTMYIGGQDNPATRFKGSIDSMRISTMLRSTDVPTEEFGVGLSASATLLMPHPLQSTSRIIALSDYHQILNDIDDCVDPAGQRPSFVAEIGDTPVELSIGSWQATQQIGRKQYLQCVVHNVADVASTIVDKYGETFALYRIDTINGNQVRTKMGEAVLDYADFSRGHTNYSCVIYGYAASADTPTVPQTRTLRAVSSATIASSGKSRIRASTEYMLYPGDTVEYGTDSFTADYINYYVTISGTTIQAYMDVGAR